MKILSNTFTIFFPIVNNMREFLFEFEKMLPQFNLPFNLVSVPDGTPPDIPRITAATKHGHTQLTITQHSAQVATKYDEAYTYDINRCWQYIEEKKSQLIDCIHGVLRQNFCFGGLTTIMTINNFDDPVEFICKKFYTIKSKPLSDTVVRLTYTLDETYYVNIEISNVSEYEGINMGNPMSLAGMIEKSSFLQIILDVNDRYSFNKHSEYISDENKIEALFSLSKNIISNKIPVLLEKGEIDI